MKVTGIILAIIGLVGGAICMVSLLQPDAPGRDAAQTRDAQMPRPNMVVPLAICGAAVVIGSLMFAYGGKGYYVSNNPEIRN